MSRLALARPARPARIAALFLSLAATGPAAVAAPDGPTAERFFSVTTEDLRIVSGRCAVAWNSPHRLFGTFGPSAASFPRVFVDGGEGFVVAPDEQRAAGRPAEEVRLVLRAPGSGDVSGRLIVADPWLHNECDATFRVDAGRADATAREDFQRTKAGHYRRLLEAGLPGAPYFRMRLAEAESALEPAARPAASLRRGEDPVAQELQQVGPRDGDGLEETLALFGGGRAIHENLQLDRGFVLDLDGDPIIDVASLAGISGREIDFSGRLGDAGPLLDPLARLVAADQYAVFFPSFEALVALLDEADRTGTPIAQLSAEQASDHRARQRAERQLCLQLDAWTRRLGPLVVNSVALTGSDAYVRSGTDLAVLLECSDAASVLAMLEAAHRLAVVSAGAELLRGTTGALEWFAARTPDRGICSYVARVGDTVLVTNSPAQLAALDDVVAGRRAALETAPEYRFFRHRYARGDAAESALVVISDAAIRRFCSPRWRIGASRRVRAAAELAELAVREKVGGGLDAAAAGRRQRLRATYGDLAFLTPIAELDVARATPAEADAYRRFATTYQAGFARALDPIAVRIGASASRCSADLTVLPLIEGTEYDELMELCRGATLAPFAGRPHAGAIAQLALALDVESILVREAGDFLSAMNVGSRVNPLSWVGDHVTVWLDDDPLWSELAEAEDLEEHLESQLTRLPVGARLAVRDPALAAIFVTGLRAFAEQTVPGVLAYETVEHGDGAFVRVAAANPRAPAGAGMPEFAFCYALTPKALLLAVDDGVMRRSLDREREDPPAVEPDDDRAWLGESLAVRADRRAFAPLEALLAEAETRLREERSWRNLPILDEWRRLFPGEDPVQVHQELFDVTLVCPGGGRYVHDEAAGGMVSTAFGSPVAPRREPVEPSLLDRFESVRCGVTFEDDGLRGRFDLRRRAPSAPGD